MAHELDVWLFSDRIGSLSLRNGRLSFCYSPTWLTRKEASALSISLPLQGDPFDDSRSRSFFAGLLPEGELRLLIARQMQVSGRNDFALLEKLGGECAGAVTLTLPDQARLPTSSRNDVEWLSDLELVNVLGELPRRPMLIGQEGLRLSLAGAQDKLPVVFDGDRIGLPRNGFPSTHILKPPIPGVHDSVRNEGFCMMLAGLIGLNTAKTSIQQVMEKPFLLVERYDRYFNSEKALQRLHQEDFCQALGVLPELKYQSEGGPDLRQCFDLIRRVTRPSATHVLQLLDAVVFNALVGNHDAHGKNFSLLYREGQPQLAPVYDVLSTAVYPELTPKMAMKIGSRYKFSDVHPRHWYQFAEEAGLSKSLLQKRILELARLLPEKAHHLWADPEKEFRKSAIVEQVVALIEQRCAQTINRFKNA